jgi:plastocyanin
MSIRVLFVIALLALIALCPGAARADGNQLVATVGPGFTIDVADASGKHVDSLPAGHYTLVVHDLSAEHNFVLADKPAGLRLRVETEVEFVGDKSFEIDLQPGRYAYACSPHWEVMNGGFTAVAPSTPPAAPAPKALRATVAAGGTLSLSARRVAPGRYRLTVADRSPTRNFHLVGPGVNRRTTAAFVGTATWSLALARGTYRFGSDPALSGRLVVG